VFNNQKYAALKAFSQMFDAHDVLALTFLESISLLLPEATAALHSA
jgi:hypothetical protein